MSTILRWFYPQRIIDALFGSLDPREENETTGKRRPMEHAESEDRMDVDCESQDATSLIMDCIAEDNDTHTITNSGGGIDISSSPDVCGMPFVTAGRGSSSMEVTVSSPHPEQNAISVSDVAIVVVPPTPTPDTPTTNSKSPFVSLARSIIAKKAGNQQQVVTQDVSLPEPQLSTPLPSSPLANTTSSKAELSCTRKRPRSTSNDRAEGNIVDDLSQYSTPCAKSPDQVSRKSRKISDQGDLPLDVPMSEEVDDSNRDETPEGGDTANLDCTLGGHSLRRTPSRVRRIRESSHECHDMAITFGAVGKTTESRHRPSSALNGAGQTDSIMSESCIDFGGDHLGMSRPRRACSVVPSRNSHEKSPAPVVRKEKERKTASRSTLSKTHSAKPKPTTKLLMSRALRRQMSFSEQVNSNNESKGAVTLPAPGSDSDLCVVYEGIPLSPKRKASASGGRASKSRSVSRNASPNPVLASDGDTQLAKSSTRRVHRLPSRLRDDGVFMYNNSKVNRRGIANSNCDQLDVSSATTDRVRLASASPSDRRSSSSENTPAAIDVIMETADGSDE